MVSEPIVVVQGGQWGREGKSQVVQHLVETNDTDIIVFSPGRGNIRQLPTCAEHGHVVSVLGPGSVLDRNRIRDEVFASDSKQVVIDRNASVVVGNSLVPYGEWLRHSAQPSMMRYLKDSTEYLLKQHSLGKRIVIEGNGGSLLGPQCSATNQVRLAGLPLTLPYRVILAVRALAARPPTSPDAMYKTTWATTLEHINSARKDHKLPPLRPDEVIEREDGDGLPLVPHLFDPVQVKSTAMKEGASSLAMTFLDYAYPGNPTGTGVTCYLETVRETIGIPVGICGWKGPEGLVMRGVG
jgi:hypothetical protein